MRLTRGNPYVAGAALVAVLAAVIVGAASINLSFGLPFNLQWGWPPSQDYTLRASFQDANGVVKGANVVIAGDQIGQVTAVDVSQREAVVTMRIHHQFAPLHQGTIARIRYSTLLAQKYIELTPAAGTAALANGARIASDETVTPVDFDQFLSSLDPQTRSQVRVLVQQLGGGVNGRRAAINALLDQLAQLGVESRAGLSTLRTRDPELASITGNLAVASARLAQSHQQLGDLVGSTAVVTETLDENTAPLDSLLVHLATSMDQVDRTLDGNQGNLHQTLTELDPFLIQLNDQLTTTYPYLVGGRSSLRSGFSYLTPYITSAISQQDANGNFLRQFVVVNLCYDTPDKKKSNPADGCLVQAISGLTNPAPNGPNQPASGQAPPGPPGAPGAANCPSPSPTVSAPPTPTPSGTPCPTPSPCGPSPSPGAAATPTPTACPSPGGGAGTPSLPDALGGALDMLLGGGR
jgi:virulence factor Mce-like protein